MTVLAWHFVGATLRDGRPIPADGEWLVHKGPVVWCESGLYASRRPWHALQYAPGATLCRVECDDIEKEDADKLVCRRRRIIERADITETLRYFARMQALSVIHLWPQCPPYVVLDYLMTGDESLRAAAWAAAGGGAAWAAAGGGAAWAAAWDAAWDAAWGAAWGAARAVACDAVRRANVVGAARSAEWNIAMAAARSAEWNIAMAAARNIAGREFDALVYEQFGITGEQT